MGISSTLRTDETVARRTARMKMEEMPEGLAIYISYVGGVSLARSAIICQRKMRISNQQQNSKNVKGNFVLNAKYRGRCVSKCTAKQCISKYTAKKVRMREDRRDGKWDVVFRTKFP